MKQQIKKLLGKSVLKKIRPIYHKNRAFLMAARYGFPAKKLKLVGITGTKGKTSTTVLTGRLLNLTGTKAGYISTAEIFDGKQTYQNPFKMTTIDSAKMQEILNKMIKNGCAVAVLEISSEGLAQGRHNGLFGFDVAVFLNIFPEHIESHGSFAKYVAAKSILFENIRPHGFAVVNGNFEESNIMIAASQKRQSSSLILYPQNEYRSIQSPVQIFKQIDVGGQIYKTNFYAEFELENVYFAIKLVQLVRKLNDPKLVITGLDQDILNRLPELNGISGRMEFVVESNEVDILVDYAHEPESMKQLLLTLRKWVENGIYTKVIHVVSCDGVGRDDWKKPMLGKLSYDYADFSVLTTDNYSNEDNPYDIVNLLAKELPKNKLDKKYIQEIDRKNAFFLALRWAIRQPGKVLIVSTGVGSENGLTQPNGKMEWDEGGVWKETFDKVMAKE